jgi:hypothetical protein
MCGELTRRFRDYAPHQDVPLAGYAGTMATYLLLIGGVLPVVARRSRSRSEPGWAELTLLGIATHKLSRLLTKDAVTAPLRAPFSHRKAQEGAGEVQDEPRGSGPQRTVGQLLTCPYCAGPWLGLGLSTSLAWRPVQTRFVLRLLTAVTIADFLHLAYARLNESRKKVQAERQLDGRG